MSQICAQWLQNVKALANHTSLSVWLCKFQFHWSQFGCHAGCWLCDAVHYALLLSKVWRIFQLNQLGSAQTLSSLCLGISLFGVKWNTMYWLVANMHRSCKDWSEVTNIYHCTVAAQGTCSQGASQNRRSGTSSGTTPVPYPRSIPPFHTSLKDPFHTSVPYLWSIRYYIYNYI